MGHIQATTSIERTQIRDLAFMLCDQNEGQLSRPLVDDLHRRLDEFMHLGAENLPSCWVRWSLIAALSDE